MTAPAMLPVWFALVGVLLSSITYTWRHVTTHMITVTHEFGHAAMALALGGRPTGIRLNSDSSGVTNWRAPRAFRRLRGAIVAASGAPAPGIIGAAALWATVNGYQQWALAGLSAVAVLVAVLIRNLWGLAIIVVLLLVCWTTYGSGDPTVTAAMTSVTAGVLIAGGLRGAWTEHRVRRQPGCDADQMRQMLFLPAAVWSGMFLALSTACVVGAVWSACTAIR